MNEQERAVLMDVLPAGVKLPPERSMVGMSPRYRAWLAAEARRREVANREHERQLVQRVVLALALFAVGMLTGLGLAYLLPTLEALL